MGDVVREGACIVVSAADGVAIEDAAAAARREVKEQGCDVVDQSTRMFAFGDAEGHIVVDGTLTDIEKLKRHDAIERVQVEVPSEES